MDIEIVTPKEAENKKLTAIIYGLYASSIFLGITAIIAVIINS